MADTLVCLFYLFLAHILSLIPVAVFLIIPLKPSFFQFKWRFFRYALISTVLLPLVFVIALPLGGLVENIETLPGNEKYYSFPFSREPLLDSVDQQSSVAQPKALSFDEPGISSLSHSLVKWFLLLWLTSLSIGVFRFCGKILKQERLLKRLRTCSIKQTHQNTQVYVSHRLRGAFCRSWPRREIYIPAREWADEKLRQTILVHESQHLANRHPDTLLLASFLKHLYQLNPLLHLAAHQGEELSEYICDFHGTQVIPPKDYLSQLLRSAEQKLSQGSFLPLSSPWLKQGELKKRVKMLLALNREDKMKTKKLNGLIAAMVLALLGISLACGSHINLMAQDIRDAENDAAQAQGAVEQAENKVGFESENRQMQSVPLIWPILEVGRITLAFGETTHPLKGSPYFHKGVDIAWAMGTPVKAALGGIVTETGYEPKARGHYMVISHDSGYEVLYSHLDSIDVSKGQGVKEGQILAKLGNSGLSTGPHLHFEVHNPAGESIDPLEFFPELQEKSDYSE